MLRKVLLPTIILVLAYGLWLSPDFKTIAAGVAIFLFGMLSLEEGFRAFTGGILEKILKRTTSNLGRSVGFGVITTTIMQSSSLVSVITISFLSAGLITLAAGIGIIFGANLGTTTGAWLVAGFGLKVKISAYAMPMLIFGIILVFQKSKSLRGVGYILAGLGFLFLGIHYMKEGFETFKETIDLASYSVPGYPGLFLFAGIGVFATVVMQSSHATLVLIITALAAQQISYENALALAIGANVGTTITAILGSMSANEQGKRLAGAHLIFNLVTGLIAILFIYQLIFIVDQASMLFGISADDYTLKLALFHTVFNLIGIIVMLPFVNRLVTFLTRLIPAEREEIDQPKYLADASAEFPDTAVEAVRKETVRVYMKALKIIISGIGLRKGDVLSDVDLEQAAATQKRLRKINIDAAYQKHIKQIYSAIIAFVSTANFSWQDEQSGQIHWLREANLLIAEAVKDVKHLQKNLHHYLNADNPGMRSVYNMIRVQIGTIIRELEEIRNADENSTNILSLDTLKLTIEEDQKELNDTISKLIRNGRITPEMASSLVNDSAYAHNISSNLIQVAETLCKCNTEKRELNEAARGVALNEDELIEVHEQRETPATTTES